MAKLVVLHQFGHPFDTADQVFVIRARDIGNHGLLKKILGMMRGSKTTSPKEFFEKKKICFLAAEDVFNAFLDALLNEEKNL